MRVRSTRVTQSTQPSTRARSIAPLRRWCQALWAIYLISYPIAVIGVAFDVRPGFSLAWAGSVLLCLQGALAALWLLIHLGVPQGGRITLLIAIGAYLGETLGVATGFPFGSYSYTKVLFPILPGSVPLPVIGAWLMVVVTSVAVARLLYLPFATPVTNMPHPWRARVWRLALVGTIGVALDYVLEPAAVHLEGYWVWHTNSANYGIPTTNFWGWMVLCALLATPLLNALSHPLAPDPAILGERATIAPSEDGSKGIGVMPRAWHEKIAWLIWTPSLVMLYFLTLAMFTIVDATHGITSAAWSGVAALVALVLTVRVRVSYNRER